MIKFLAFAAILAVMAWQVTGATAGTIGGRASQIDAAIDAASK